MLVIGRKLGQTIRIGEDVEITISSIRGDQVRLAIQAPRSVTILRKETIQEVAEGNAAAIDLAPDLGQLSVLSSQFSVGNPNEPVPVPQLRTEN